MRYINTISAEYFRFTMKWAMVFVFVHDDLHDHSVIDGTLGDDSMNAPTDPALGPNQARMAEILSARDSASNLCAFTTSGFCPVYGTASMPK